MDVDECGEESHECVKSDCDNSEGSYICNCLSGYAVDNSGNSEAPSLIFS